MGFGLLGETKDSIAENAVRQRMSGKAGRRIVLF